MSVVAAGAGASTPGTTSRSGFTAGGSARKSAAASADSGSKWSADFIKSMASMSLRDIQREPSRLKAESEELMQELDALSFQHYSAFLKSASLVGTVSEQMSRMDVDVTHFVDDAIPKLSSACEAFVRLSENTVQQQRKRDRALALQANHLQSLLEIPLLMDSCMRTSLYDELSSLADFVMLRPSDGILGQIQDEVRKCCRTFVDQFWEMLEGRVSLHQSLKIMHYIRRMSAHVSGGITSTLGSGGLLSSSMAASEGAHSSSFSEREMQHRFLACRDRWAAAHCRRTTQQGDQEHLSQFIFDAYRETTNEVVAQFRYLFGGVSGADRSAPASGGSGGRQNRSLLDAGPSTAFMDPLVLWVAKRGRELSALVRSRLSKILDGDELRVLADEMAHSRTPIIERCIAHVEDRVFELYRERISSAHGLLSSVPLVQVSDQRGLMQWPVLAALHNGYMRALNELRVVAFRSLKNRVIAWSDAMTLEVPDEYGIRETLRKAVRHVFQLPCPAAAAVPAAASIGGVENGHAQSLPADVSEVSAE